MIFINTQNDGDKICEPEETTLEKLFSLLSEIKLSNNIDVALVAASAPLPALPPECGDKFFLLIDRELAETLLAVTANVNPGNQMADALLEAMDQLAEAMGLDDDDLTRIYRKAKIEIQNPEDLLSGITVL